MIILMQMYALLGFIAHLYREPMTGHMSADWQDLSNKTLGVLYGLPLALFMFSHLEKDIENAYLRFLISYLLAFSSFGMGVTIGFWYLGPGRKR